MDSSYSGYDVRAGRSRKTNSADLGSDKQGVTSIDDLDNFEGPVDLPPLDIPKNITSFRIPIHHRFCSIGKPEDMMYDQLQYNVLELHRDGDSWIVD